MKAKAFQYVVTAGAIKFCIGRMNKNKFLLKLKEKYYTEC